MAKNEPPKGDAKNPHKEKKVAVTVLYPDKEIKRMMKEINDEFAVMRIWGSVGAAREISTPYGLCPKFTGNFKAIRAKDGHFFESRVAYLPGYIADELMAAFNLNGEVSFALDLFAKPSDKGSEGYEFVHTDLMEPAAVADTIASKLPEYALLPAPKTEEPEKGNAKAEKKAA